MSDVVRIVNKEYNDSQTLAVLINYILTDKNNKPNFCYYIGGINVNPHSAFQEMMYTKKFFRKTEGRYVRHFIVSPDKNLVFMGHELYTLAFQISAYYSQRYQIIFSVHEDTDHWHIHFVMNTVSFVDGKMFSEGPYELAQFKDYVEALIRIYENRFNRQMLGYD